jgi:hypothetical protein
MRPQEPVGQVRDLALQRIDLGGEPGGFLYRIGRSGVLGSGRPTGRLGVCRIVGPEISASNGCFRKGGNRFQKEARISKSKARAPRGEIRLGGERTNAPDISP